MSTVSRFEHLEESLKEKHLNILQQQSHLELKAFKKYDYKKRILSEICDSLPDCQESQFDQLALCVVNFLQNEVKSLLRNTSADNPTPKTTQNLLSETVLNELDLTLQPTVNATDSDADDTGEHDESIQSNTSVLDTSITKLKQTANLESNPSKTAKNNKSESNKLTKHKSCFDECKVKKTSKKKYAEIQCIFCTKWYHEVCVGIKESDPVGIWICPVCRNVPSEIKKDISCLTQEVSDIKQCTQSIVKAIESLTFTLQNNIENINDKLTSVSKQINSTDLCISESIETLQASTSNIKTTLDNKTCQILNKTTAVFDKVKTYSENSKGITNVNTAPTCQSQLVNKPVKQNNKLERHSSANKTSKALPETQVGRIMKPKDKLLVSNANKSSNDRNNQSEPPNQNSRNTYIDLTKNPNKVINKSTLLVGSSILKGVQTSELKSNAAVRTFSGATIDVVKTKLGEFDIENCKTIILHVGGNDADNGTDPEDFCDSYISLLDNLVADDRRIIVSGLLPRQGVDLEPFNNKLKALCAENDIEYVDHFDSFLLASGEMAEMYFFRDRTHLNRSGTRKFLTNIDNVFKVLGVANSASRSKRTFSSNKRIQGFRHMAVPRQRYSPRMSSKYCHICSLNNHNTAECWFNGRNTRQQPRFSR